MCVFSLTCENHGVISERFLVHKPEVVTGYRDTALNVIKKVKNAINCEM